MNGYCKWLGRHIAVATNSTFHEVSKEPSSEDPQRNIFLEGYIHIQPVS